jgi:hypothetical protein
VRRNAAASRCAFNRQKSLATPGNHILEAKDKGADLLVTPCPLCHLNLDGQQPDAERVLHKNIDVPIFHLPQLLGLAFGLEPAGAAARPSCRRNARRARTVTTGFLLFTGGSSGLTRQNRTSHGTNRAERSSALCSGRNTRRPSLPEQIRSSDAVRKIKMLMLRCGCMAFDRIERPLNLAMVDFDERRTLARVARAVAVAGVIVRAMVADAPDALTQDIS